MVLTTAIFEGATSPGYKKLENVWCTGYFSASGWTPAWPLRNAITGDFKTRRPTGRPLLSKIPSRYGLSLWARVFVAWLTNPGAWLECQLYDIMIINWPVLSPDYLPVQLSKQIDKHRCSNFLWAQPQWSFVGHAHIYPSQRSPNKEALHLC